MLLFAVVVGRTAVVAVVVVVGRTAAVAIAVVVVGISAVVRCCCSCCW